MGLASLASKRPVGTAMVMLMILFLGAISVYLIPIDLLPELALPTMAVMTDYPGAGPHEVESLITEPIEEAVGMVPGAKHIRSESSEGVSRVVVEFSWGTDLDIAALEIRENLDRIRDILPGDAESPAVTQADPSMMPIMELSVSGPYELAELSYLTDSLQSQLERVEGVASVNVRGEVLEEVSIQPQPSRLNSYGLTIDHIAQTLSRENINLPAGHLEEAGQRLTLRTMGEFISLDDIRNTNIVSPRGSVVNLGDMADVRMAQKEADSLTRLNGEPAITLAIQAQSGVNTVQVAGQIHSALEQLRQEIPNDAALTIVSDESDFIRRSIATVTSNVLYGGILAVIILFLFLAHGRTVVVIGLAIPLSVMATFAFMYFSGLTLNLISMGGLALGVGMLVDNAIVILENVFRIRESGTSPYEAAVQGTTQVAPAVIASTLTTVSVFLPVVFIEGLAAQLFEQLSLTISFALLSSLLVSLTFIPMASTVFLTEPADKDVGLAKYSHNIQSLLRKGYGEFLDITLDKTSIVLVSVVLILLLTVYLGSVLPSSFIPELDQRELNVDVDLPQGTALQVTDGKMQEIEDLIARREDVEFFFTSSGGTTQLMGGREASSHVGNARIKLIEDSPQQPDTDEVASQIRRDLGKIAGADFRVSTVSGVVGEDQFMGSPVEVRVIGDDFNLLAELAEDVTAIVDDVPGTVNARTTWEEGAPEIRFNVDRQRAAQFGLSAGEIGTMLRAAVQGITPTRYRVGGHDIDIRIIFPPEHREDLRTLQNMIFLTPGGKPATLDQLVTIERESGPTTISRSDRTRTIDIKAELDDRQLGAVMEDVENRVEKLELPSGFSLEFGGETQEMFEAFDVLGDAFIIGCILVYMVLAAQFESFLQPFIVMITIPLALFGVVSALYYWGLQISVPAIIGVIGMAGIAVNNSIVMISYINQLREQGQAKNKAIKKACQIRLRPILMTSLTTILGLLPMAVARGAGAELQNAMAASVLGGLLASTLLTLLVTPTIYSLLAREQTGGASNHESN